MNSTDSTCGCSRRDFLHHTVGCAAWVTGLLALATPSLRRAFAQGAGGEIVAETKFARVEQIAEGAWAVISTPQGGQFTTVSNGGIIAGKEAVLAIEGFMNPKGAEWLSEVAEEIAGRRPTHVAMTHFHSDHIGGFAGYATDGELPRLVVTQTVRDRLKPDQAAHDDTVVVGDDTALDLDLGGRTMRFKPRRGHTPSDLTVDLVEPRITWCGDLFWNQMFPNYVDALPTVLESQCRQFLSEEEATYIPGHGSVADRGAIENYLGLLADIEATARDAHAKGIPAEDVAKTYQAPEALGEWARLLPTIHQAAFTSWEAALNRE